MAPFINLNHPFASLLTHPVHTNIFEPTQGIRLLNNLVDDPWYTAHLNQKYKNREGITTPDFDVVETSSAYFLEGNFAGIKNKTDIKIEWIGNRTLVIEADVEREDLELVWGIQLGEDDDEIKEAVKSDEPEHMWVDKTRKTINGKGQQPVKRTENSHPTKKNSTHHHCRTWLAERHLGPMQRSFTFPRDIAADGLRAKLRNGVLLMMVPKAAIDREDESRKRVVIEDDVEEKS
jgi:HSP20 family molecular chaperone IbpA